MHIYIYLSLFHYLPLVYTVCLSLEDTSSQQYNDPRCKCIKVGF